MGTRWLGYVLCGSLLGACAGSQPPAVDAHAPARADAPATAPTPPAAAVPSDLRRLPEQATFAELVYAARKLDDASQTQSDAQCLLRGSTVAWLDADLLPGLRPLPAAPDELGTALAADPGSLTILSAWGRIAGTGQLALAAFTTTTTSAVGGASLAVVMTRTGVYLRGDHALLRAHPEAMPADQAIALLGQLPLQAGSALYVSAEAAVPVTQLRELLRVLPGRFEVALAVMLPKGTRLPGPSAASSELLCPGGLPEPAATEGEGDLETRALRDALAPLRDAGLSCAVATGGRAWLGGRIVLSLRIGKDGHVRELCMSEDAVAEPLLRRCIAEHARRIVFPAPEPRGFVDVALPLQIDLGGPPRQRALCD